MSYKLIFSDNNSLTDLSTKIKNHRDGEATLPIVASEDYLYIGSRYPFNSIYFKFKTANTNTTTVSVSYWEGNEWTNAVEVIDETNGFKNDGYVTFVPDKNESSWLREDTVQGDGNSEEVQGLGTLVIYDHYWLRLKFSNDLSATTSLNWIGDLFCSDEDMYSEYPIFNSSNLKLAYKAGKTDWENQRIRASDLVISDLVTRNIIEDSGQLLDKDKLKLATVSRTAQIIFNALGDDYVDDTLKAKKEYGERVRENMLSVDKNANARLDVLERRARQGFITR